MSSSSSATCLSPTEDPFAYLTDSQSQAFVTLKKLVETDHEYWPAPSEALNNAQELHDHTLLYADPFSLRALNGLIAVLQMSSLTFPRRYLRARHYDPRAAYKQYIATGAWRRKLVIDSYYDNAEVSSFEETRRLVFPSSPPSHPPP